LAILGSAGDLATSKQISLAADLGREAALRGLTCVVGGDDGVMGAAARAAKEAGGTTVAVLPREKTLRTPELFDATVDTGLGWVQFSDAVLRSSCAAIVIGGGAGTLGEIAMAYIAGLPTAFLSCGDDLLAGTFGGGALDDRNLATLLVHETPAAALDAVLPPASTAEHVGQRAAELHFASYPFGTASNYVEAAELYRSAMVATRNPSVRAAMSARHQDALGDHFYYHVQDFLRAASHYANARIRLEEPADPGFALYLNAIALESIAFGLSDIGEHRLAANVALVSAERYEGGLIDAAADERAHLFHSAAGLRGDAAYYKALDAAAVDDLLAAETAIASARGHYRDALRHQPAWADGSTTDTYERAVGLLDDLEQRLAGAAERPGGAGE
jgi:uncharacterized protein (TIGR00725 family)